MYEICSLNSVRNQGEPPAGRYIYRQVALLTKEADMACAVGMVAMCVNCVILILLKPKYGYC